MKNLLKTFPTNINNTNYYNNNNNNNDTNNLTTNNYYNSRGSLDQHGVKPIELVTSSSLELASPREKELLDSKSKEKEILLPAADVNKMPDAWKFCKWDIFLNGKTKKGLDDLKLKLLFANKNTGKQHVYVSALNTYWESGRMSYNVNKDEWKTSFHWTMVRKHYHSIKNLYTDIRSSKLTSPNKGSPTPVAVFVYCDQGVWVIDMVLDGKVYTFALNGDLTDAQIATNIVATVKIGGTQKKMLTLQEGGFL